MVKTEPGQAAGTHLERVKHPLSRQGRAPASRSPGDAQSVLVVGLGRFGSAVATSLVSLGHEVLAVDNDPRIVQTYADKLTHVVQVDSTSEEALRQIGAHEFGTAIVAIGAHLEASILTTSVLADLGISFVLAKALSREHGRILGRVGAHEVVYPEQAMGERVAHLVTGKMMDFIEFDDGFALVKTRAPAEAINKTLSESALRGRYGVTVVGTKRTDQDFVYARPETVIRDGDLLIVCGDTRACERFASIT
jgi:trk system potassium uptake protein